MNISQAELLAIDFETTGVVAEYPAEPWQIGLVRMRDRKVSTETYESLLLVDQDRPFNHMAPGRHAELREELAAAPTMGQLWPELRTWCQVPLVAHNAATEKKHLRAAAPIHKFGPWIDTLKLARIAYPAFVTHKLDDLVDILKLRKRVDAICPERVAHDALYDAIACGMLLEHLLALPGWESLTVDQLATAKPTAFYRARASKS